MTEPSLIIRTTLGEFLSNPDYYNGSGVYVLACFPSLGFIYVGISQNVSLRWRQHLSNYDGALMSFISGVFCDAMTWRLDILIPPDGFDESWLFSVENALIQSACPLLNVVNNNRVPSDFPDGR